eukprot:12928558-Prorocentrum_lima.AAC.1
MRTPSLMRMTMMLARRAREQVVMVGLLASKAPEEPKPRKFKHGQAPAVGENLQDPPAPPFEG